MRFGLQAIKTARVLTPVSKALLNGLDLPPVMAFPSMSGGRHWQVDGICPVCRRLWLLRPVRCRLHQADLLSKPSCADAPTHRCMLPHRCQSRHDKRRPAANRKSVAACGRARNFSRTRRNKSDALAVVVFTQLRIRIQFFPVCHGFPEMVAVRIEQFAKINASAFVGWAGGAFDCPRGGRPPPKRAA